MNPALAHILFWVAAASCVVAHGAIIWSVLTGGAAGAYPDDRRKSARRGGIRWGADRRTPPDANGVPSRSLEIGWAVLPALALGALLAATWLALPQ